MKTITKFLKVTLVGGLLVVLPLWVSLLLLLKAIKGALAMLLPIAKLLPQAVVHEKVVALGLLLVICFVVGLIIRTQPGEASRPLDRRTHTWSYSRVFAYARYDPTIGWGQGRAVIPTGTGGDRGRIGAGIHHRETYGRTAHGIRLVHPTPMAGAIYILSPERVHPVDVPLRKAIVCVTKWGAGAAEMRAAIRPGKT